HAVSANEQPESRG
nr:immunoglobulin heavy chain junction region [Homo sapiens]